MYRVLLQGVYEWSALCRRWAPANRWVRLVGACLLLGSIMLLSGPKQLAHAAPLESGDFTLIAHRSAKTSSLRKQELMLIFSGRKRAWARSNQPIQLILLPSGSKEMSWLSDQLQMPEHLLRRFIFQRVYRGTMRTPIEVSTSEEAIQAIERNPGSLAPIWLSEALRSRFEGGAQTQSQLIELKR